MTTLPDISGRRHLGGVQPQHKAARNAAIADAIANGFTCQQVADRYGLTRQRVSQLYAKERQRRQALDKTAEAV